MKAIILTLSVLLSLVSLKAQTPYGDQPLAHTYSIVAYDSITGDMGVAVQSHWFSVGSLVLWGEAGVGAIATQSLVNPAFGPQGLALLKTGLDAEQTLNALVASDEGREVRQLAVVDSKGKAKAYTGAKCIADAGHIEGKGYTVQANMMKNDKVWGAMSEAYENAEGSLAERLMAALEAAQAVGGDIRGKQSAALLVVSGKSTGQVWADRKVDLRVEDHKTPVKELRRLLQLHKAYNYMNEGDLAMEHGDIDGALKSYGSAQELNPDNLEMKYWHAISLTNAGKIEDALPMFKKIFAENADWRTLTERLIKPGFLVVDEKTLERILKQ